MNLRVVNRKIHYWISIALAIPILIVVCTGLLLQVKKQVAWIQPPEHRGSGNQPEVTFARILEVSRGVREASIKGWSDISTIDIRPGRGMMKVKAKNGWEIQIDSASGSVLQVAYRRSDVIESLHDGSWFPAGVKMGVFLPAGVLLLVSWVTGLYLFFLPFAARRRRALKSRELVSA